MKRVTSPVLILIWTLQFFSAVEQVKGLPSALGGNRNRTVRDVTCRENMEYLHGVICCQNCPAGSHVKSPCSRASERGVCEKCDFGSYTEHDNGLSECLPCTKCRSDQDRVHECTSTRNSQCQCKEGHFCLPDQPCEICKTCRRCREDEEVEKSCTHSSNTICRKRSSSQAYIAVIVLVVTGVGITLLVVILYWKRPAWCKKTLASCCSGGVFINESSCGSEELQQNGLNSALEDVQAPFLKQSPSELVGVRTMKSDEVVEEEDRGLGRSLPNTPTSSQGSLCLPVQPSHSLALSAPPPPENEKIRRRLVPLNGEESLKKCFDLFEEMDVNIHNRFFRNIGLNDNAIKNAESLSLEEKVYQLLKVWLEKEGMTADFNTLIEALLHLNQRLTAENIVTRAIANRWYMYEDI
ncbi:tumor necrosis factor receptor superfamily member 10B-like isoform X1 [Hoplias malabaricus]|uniref:tumor necrosis factor receptor superfamily member 10B-like isoform X1 n=1 Tax=Hoplias malabaricus TaxID=27720 RepID=UPI0034625531